jgi:hypothetical protein
MKERVLDINNPTPFHEIAKELGEEEATVWSCHKQALVKLQVALRRRGYKVEDFFGGDYDCQ